jgi:hypothetical protein
MDDDPMKGRKYIVRQKNPINFLRPAGFDASPFCEMILRCSLAFNFHHCVVRQGVTDKEF